MFSFLKRRNTNQAKDCKVRFRIDETVVFTGTVESLDIVTDLKGSECYATITFNAEDLTKKLRLITDH